jgi:hypothetical protein
MVKFMTAAAIVFAATAGVLWGMFLRPVPIRQGTAEIKAKTFKAAGTYWQQQVGINRGFRTPTPITVDESYVLELYSKEIDSTGFVAIPTAEQSKYTIGQSVAIEYQRRGLPLLGYRTTVLSIQPQPQ